MTVIVSGGHIETYVADLNALQIFDRTDITVEISTSAKVSSQVDMVHIWIKQKHVTREMILAAALFEIGWSKFPEEWTSALEKVIVPTLTDCESDLDWSRFQEFHHVVLLVILNKHVHEFALFDPEHFCQTRA